MGAFRKKAVMRDYSIINSSFWSSAFFKKISGNLELTTLSLYLQTHPDSNMIGVFRLRLSDISRHLGMNAYQILRSMKQLQRLGFCLYDAESEEIYLNDYARTQMGYLSQESFHGLKINDNRVKAVNKQWAKIESLVLKTLFYRFYRDKMHLPHDWTPEEDLRRICRFSDLNVDLSHSHFLTMEKPQQAAGDMQLSFEKVYYDTVFSWQKPIGNSLSLFQNVFDGVFYPEEMDPDEIAVLEDFGEVERRESLIRLSVPLSKQTEILDALQYEQVKIPASAGKKTSTQTENPKEDSFNDRLFDNDSAPIPAGDKIAAHNGVPENYRFEMNEKAQQTALKFGFFKDDFETLASGFLNSQTYMSEGKAGFPNYLKNIQGRRMKERFDKVIEMWNITAGSKGCPQVKREFTETYKGYAKKFPKFWELSVGRAKEFLISTNRKTEELNDEHVFAWIQMLLNNLTAEKSWYIGWVNGVYSKENYHVKFEWLMNRGKVENFIANNNAYKQRRQSDSPNNFQPILHH